MDILTKRGTHHNELTRHRYDAILHKTTQPTTTPPTPTIDWTTLDDLVDLRRVAAMEAPITTTRRKSTGDLRGGFPTRGWLVRSPLRMLREGGSADEAREALDVLDGIEPETLYALFPDVVLTPSEQVGCYDAVFGGEWRAFRRSRARARLVCEQSGRRA